MSEQNYLLLKWGTLKGWNLKGNEKALEAFERYCNGPTSAGVMTQRDTPEQKQAICDIIDALEEGQISNDWSGEDMTKEEAKEYVMGYGR